MFKLARLKLAHFLCVFCQGDFKLLGFESTGEWGVERYCIPFLELANIEVRHFFNFEARVVCALSPVFVLEIQFLVLLDLVNSVNLFVKLDCGGRLSQRSVDVSTMDAFGLPRTQRVLLCSHIRVDLAVTGTFVGERCRVTKSANVLSYQGNKHVLVIQLLLALVVDGAFRVQLQRVLRNKWRHCVETIEALLHFTGCGPVEGLARILAFTCLFVKASKSSLSLNDHTAVRSILDISLQFQDAVVQAFPSGATERNSIPSNVFFRLYRILEVVHSVQTTVVVEDAYPNLILNWLLS